MNIFYLLPLLLSFAALPGDINANYYIKIFAFGLSFIFMCFSLYIKEKANLNCCLSISLADVTILFLGGIYLYYCMGAFNILDHSLPIVYILFYFFLRLIHKRNWSDILMTLSPIIISIHLILCFLQYIYVFPNFNTFFRVGSSFGNPDMLSAYLAMLLPFCYLGNKWKRIRIMVVLITVALFFMLQSRTAIVAVAVMTFVYLVCQKMIAKKGITIILILILLVMMLLICWYPKSVLGRFYIWIVALSMILNKPLGWGLYSFEKYYPEFQSRYTIENPEVVSLLNYDIVHSSYNEFLNVGVTLGIIGLLFYSTFVIYVLILAYRMKSPLLFPLLAYQIISLFYFPFKIVPLTVLYILCCVSVVSTDNLSFLRLSFSSKLKNCYLYGIGVIVFSGFILSIYSYVYWQKATEQSFSAETYVNASQSFRKCYPLLKNNGRFLVSYAELQYKLGDRQKAFTLMHQAESFFSDILFLHNLAMVYEEEGNVSEAKKKLSIASNMSPNNIQILIAQMQFLRRIGEYDEACQVNNLLLHRKK